MSPLFDLLFWRFRRSERDVIGMYDYLSRIMTLLTGGEMLNFGYWHDSDSPIQAQERLCHTLGELACLRSGQQVIDMGSGYGAPASTWYERYNPINISCMNINRRQLFNARHGPDAINGTASSIPFCSNSVDRILALESAQHFRPLGRFILEADRVLNDGGILALAVPVLYKTTPASLGLLSLTWPSEHHTREFLISTIRERFEILQECEIGSRVYEPLADYYTAHRDQLKCIIMNNYPWYLERILYKSINSMRRASLNGTIGYMLVSCRKRGR